MGGANTQITIAVVAVILAILFVVAATHGAGDAEAWKAMCGC